MKAIKKQDINGNINYSTDCPKCYQNVDGVVSKQKIVSFYSPIRAFCPNCGIEFKINSLTK